MSIPRKQLPALLPRVASQPRENAVAGPSSQTVSLPPRRRVVSNACNNCRSRKVKCDGSQPRCNQCVVKNLQCEFVMARPSHQRIRNYKTVLDLLRSGPTAESDEALRRLREADDIDAAVDSVAEAQLLLAASSVATGASSGEDPVTSAIDSETHKRRRLKSPSDDPGFVFERQYMSNLQDRDVDRDVFVDVPGRSLPLSRWTSVSTDDAHMNHLVNMAFTWDNAVEHLLYRPIFEGDVVALDPDTAGGHPAHFCSRFLVNALLAISCLYTHDPATFKTANDSTSRGRRWADEAELLLQKITQSSIVLLQGIYMLFIYEGNIGVGTKSVQYFNRAIDVYKALNNHEVLQLHSVNDEPRRLRERHAMSWCLWGIYCLEWRSTEAFGFKKQARRPKIDKLWREPDFPLRRPDCIGYWWYPYPMSIKSQPWMQVEIRELDALLSELVEEALDFLHPESHESSPLENPARALQLYDAFTDWKLRCPSCLRFELVVLPAAVLQHVYVEVMLVAILRPFAGFTKQEFGRFNPRDQCTMHANNLMSIIWTFRAFGQIRFEYYLTHPLGSVAYILLLHRDGEPVRMDTLVRACQCLHEMRPMLPLATDVLSGIRAAFKRYSLQIPEYMARYFHNLHHRADGLLHHAVAGFLPTPSRDSQKGRWSDIQLQRLLDEFGKFDID